MSPFSISVTAKASAAVPRTVVAVAWRGVLALAMSLVAQGTPAWALTPPPPALEGAAALTEWPRALLTPNQRLALERRRRGEVDTTLPDTPAAALPSSPQIKVLSLDGITRGPGQPTAWINGQPLRQGDEIHGLRVYIRDGHVQLKANGQPTLALKPGERVSLPGATPQDAVPPGSFGVASRSTWPQGAAPALALPTPARP